MGPDSSLTPDLIQAQSFTTAFRGYDSAEVRSFLARVAKEMRAWRERAEQLESAWHSAEERAARPPVLDEDTLMSAVGEETAAILRTARAAASELRTKAADEVERTLAEARSEAEQALTDAREEADRTLREARAEADRVQTDAKAEADRLQSEAETAMASATAAAEETAAQVLATARDDASETLAKANTEAEEIRAAADKERQLTVEGANTTRDRILEDLSRRRRVATVQIEQLRAGRERLIESYAVVRRTLEEVQSELSRADAEARAAADEVGRRLHKETEVQLSESGPAPEVDVLAGADRGPGGEDTNPTTEHPVTAEPVAGAGSPDPVGGVDAGVEAGSDGDDHAAQAGGPAAESGGPAAEGTEGAGSAVDELFARIRATRGPDSTAAEQEGAGAAGPDAGAAGPGPEPTGPEAARPEPTGGVVETEGAPDARRSDPAPPGRGEAEAEPAAANQEPHQGVTADPATAPPAGRKSKRRTARAERTAANGTAGTGLASTARAPRSGVTVIEPAAEAALTASGEPAAETASGVRAGRESASKEGARGAGERQSDDQLSTDAAPGEHAADVDEHDRAAVADSDEALLQAREFAVEELETTLTRRLKRALQDEQNDLLDRLRNLKGTPTADRLLPGAADQTARYTETASPLLAEAATAGAVFADETLGLPGRDSPVEVDVSDLAAECGTSIVDALRRRLQQAIETGAGEDQAVLVDSLGAAYREWKTQRIERLAGDVLTAAFGRGTWRAAPERALFRWIVDDADGPCPDCDDDALAGSIPKSELFPTGQPHPPAHSGCRCLLVPGLPGS